MTLFFTRAALVTLLFTGLAGCQQALIEPAQPIDCTYQVLDRYGRETTVFAQGEPIIFRYQVRNHTNHEVNVRNPSAEALHFMEVWREVGGVTQLVGKPYTTMGMYYNGYDRVPAYGTVTFSIPWVASAQHPAEGLFNVYTPNLPLPAGHYRTSVRPALALSGAYVTPDTPIPTDTANYSRYFEVR